MAKKQKKFAPKAGHPAKRAEELNARKVSDAARIEALRKSRERQKLLNELQSETPQSEQQNPFSNSVYVPPAGMDSMDDVTAPEYIINKERKEKAAVKDKPKGTKASLRKVGVVTLLSVGLGSMLFSSLSPMLMNQNTASTETEQQEVVLVDQNGNPLDGSTLPTEGATVGEELEFTVDPDALPDDNAEADKPATEDKADESTKAGE